MSKEGQEPRAYNSRGGNFSSTRVPGEGTITIIRESWWKNEFEIRIYPGEGNKFESYRNRRRRCI